MHGSHAQRLSCLNPQAPCASASPSVLSRESFPRASPSRGHRRLPEGSLAVSVPNQSPHLPSTPVSHSLERLRVPTACLRGFEIICHSACLLSLPINLITCGRGGPGGHFCALLCLLQASIFLTPGSRTLPGLSCLAPSSALMDVSGWMPPFHLHPSPTPTPAVDPT